MIVWIDAQLPPQLAPWLEKTFSVEAFAVRDLGLRDAEDWEIFEAARRAQAVVLTKDKDFVELVQRLGQPPQVLWLTFGNTTNVRLQTILLAEFPKVQTLLETGAEMIRVNG